MTHIANALVCLGCFSGIYSFVSGVAWVVSITEYSDDDHHGLLMNVSGSFVICALCITAGIALST